MAKMVKRSSPFDVPNNNNNNNNADNSAKIDQQPSKKKRTFVKRMPEKPKWEIHHEPIKAYYFHINEDKYCYVAEYDGRTVIHLRIYRRGETGNLIPTRSGACLNPNEFKHFASIATDVQAELVSQEAGQTLRQALGDTSNWYFLAKIDPETGAETYAVWLLLPTARKNNPELISTAKGITLTEYEFAKLVKLIDEISVAVKEIESAFSAKFED